MFYTCYKCDPGLKKTDMHVVRQAAFYCYCLNTSSLPQIQFTFHRKGIKQKFLICESCVIMASKSFCFSRDKKINDSNGEQFKKEHLKEKETLEGETRYDKKRKKHVPVVTHGSFVAKEIDILVVRKFYSDLSDKPNDDQAHSLATRCLAKINKLSDPSICQPKKNNLSHCCS